MEFITQSAQETGELAEKLGKLLQANSILALNGDLASGKTTFTKGIGKALGIKEVINSPTFTILKIYHGEKTLYHIDAYRLAENPYDLGFEEYLTNGGVSVIEWFDYLRILDIPAYLEIKFTYLDDKRRKLNFIAHGEVYVTLLEEFKKLC